MFFLALLPILLILFLMTVRNWGAARAGAAGYLLALLIAIVFFGAGPEVLAYAHAKALLLTLDVLLIIWAAYLLYRVADEAGAVKMLADALPHLTADKGMQALIIGWAFASFLQGVGGFGVPVAVIAPILVRLGFPALAAVVIPSLGHGWSVTFGSLGSSFQALMAASNLPQETLGAPAALFLGAAGLLSGFMVAHAAGGWATIRRLFLPTIVLGLVMSVAQWLMVQLNLWSLGAFIGGGAGLLAALPLANRWRGSGTPHNAPGRRGVVLALSGYAILVVLILGVQFIPGVKNALGVIEIHLDFPALKTRLNYVTPAGSGRDIPILIHAGSLLFYAAGLAYLIYRRAGLYAPNAGKQIVQNTLRGVMSSSVGIVAMVTMAMVMQHAGMTDALARALADGMGALFPLTSPWIGALGAFMTGSNTNSNVVFAALQLRTAELLNYAPAWILAAQTAGGALGSVIAPTKIVVGASTAGMQGREGEALRKMLGYTVLMIALISLITPFALWLTRR